MIRKDGGHTLSRGEGSVNRKFRFRLGRAGRIADLAWRGDVTAAYKSLMGASPEEVRARLGPLEPVLCPICKKDQAQVFAVDYYRLRIVRCGGCDLLYLNPRPSYAWLVKNVYVAEYHESLPSALQPLDDNLRGNLTRQLKSIERFGRPGRMLDVGCGQGGFLAFAASRGWQIFGTEVSPRAVRALEESLPQGNFFCGQMDEVDFGDLRFEAIRLNHVLEHTQNPARDLACAAERLSDEGVIYVSVPNLASLDARIKNLLSRLRLKQRRYRHLSTLHHLFFFTPASLARLASAAGLRVAALETPVYFPQGRGPVVASMYRRLLEPFGLGNCVDACLVKMPKGT